MVIPCVIVLLRLIKRYYYDQIDRQLVEDIPLRITDERPPSSSSRSATGIAVVIPELADAHLWDYVLHTRRVRRLEAILLRDGGPDLAVVIVPWIIGSRR